MCVYFHIYICIINKSVAIYSSSYRLFLGNVFSTFYTRSIRYYTTAICTTGIIAIKILLPSSFCVLREKNNQLCTPKKKHQQQ